MARIELFNAPQSTCSQRVRFVLNAKHLSFEERRLDLFSGDQLKPDYLAINPNGVVPTIRHDGAIVIDSTVIMEYLEEVFPAGRTFVPKDAVVRAQMRAIMRYVDEVPSAAIRVPSYNLAFLPHFQAMTEEEFQALADSKPLRREFILKMGRTGFSETEMNNALKRLQQTVDRMAVDIEASGGPFLLGTEPSLADISVMPTIVRMDDIRLAHMWADKPAVGRWLDAIHADPAFQPTYYPGSLLTEKYPHLREALPK
jgi:glutathione S-transferase